VSSQYLPSDMQAYAPALDQDGDWRFTQSYGYAWYPRVAADWRPYYYGRWASYPRYGWTWIGAERFAWPTHHYGRWGVSAGVWFWIPSSRWAPAYVSWGYAPGYVSWCPLGFDNRPVIALDIYRVGSGYYSPWRAWTSVSYSHFGVRGYYVNQRAVNWDRFDRSRRPRFETRPAAPGFARDIAVPRSATPIRWAGARDLSPSSGSRAVSRGNVAGPRSTGANDSSRPVRDGAGSRYVNRGDEIVRAPTARPAPRAGAPSNQPFDAAQGRPFDRSQGSSRDGAQDRALDRSQGSFRDGAQAAPRDLYAVPRSSTGVQGVPGRADRSAVEPRTLPQGSPRRANPGFERAPIDSSANPGSFRSQPREDRAQDRPIERPTVVPRSYDPAAQPESRPRAVQSPAYQPPPAPSREAAPRAYERPRPSGAESQPAPARQPERAAPAERAPNRGEGRQPAGGGSGAARPRGRGGSH
jgi:hypothetical protein